MGYRSFWDVLSFAEPKPPICVDQAHFKKNSGYVFNQVHNIMGNVPPENIVAMFDTAYEESFYETENSIDNYR